MQAIITKILPATNTKPTRIKASCARGSIISSDWPVELYCGDEKAHQHVAKHLIASFLREDSKKYGTPSSENPWGRAFVTGQLPNGDFVHVFVQ